VIIQIVFTILILGSIIGISNSFSEEIESEFGEYYSTGNVWMEITHSAAEPPPWILWKGSFQSNPPDFFGKITSDLELSKIFFDQFNIELKDLISSNKNAELCEAIGCLFGTYHLLVSEEDGEKFQVMGYNYMISKTIPPKKQQDMPIFDDKIICKPDLDLIFKSTDNSPACVKPPTAEKLIERGWTRTVSSQIEDISNYDKKFPNPNFSYQEVIKKLEKNERVSVLVLLNTSNTTFTEAKDNLELKAKIVRELQDIVLSKLPYSPDSNVKKFQYVPGFAIKLTLDNLNYLANSPLVKSISEDKEDGILDSP